MAEVAARKYEEPRAHVLRERYLATFGGAEIPVPVESMHWRLLGFGFLRERP